MSAKKKRPSIAEPHTPAAAPLEPLAAPTPSGTSTWAAAWAFGPAAAVRPYLARRLLLWILAVDVWSTHLGAAWRYGSANFNVAHFSALDALPMPTASAYVGMLALVSMGAAAAACMRRPPRALLMAVALLYTWGWSSSMHDSYQHHYLLSWLLLAIAAMPSHDATELYGPPSRGRETSSVHWLARNGLATLPHGPLPRTHAWTYRLLCIVPATVYAYTAVSKMEPEWRNGQALASLTHNGQGLESTLSLFDSLGVSGAEVWPLLGGTTVAIQITVALAYALAPLSEFDVEPSNAAMRHRGMALGAGLLLLLGGGTLALSLGHPMLLGGPAVLGAGLVVWSSQRWGVGNTAALVTGVARGVGSVGLLAALAFHAGAEEMGLEIGWFSYYMMTLAIAVLMPATPLNAAAAVLTTLHREVAAWVQRTEFNAVTPLIVALLTAAGLAALGDYARVPGAIEALLLVGILLLAAAAWAALRPEHRRAALGASFGTMIAALLVWQSLANTEERYDFFRYAGGDFRRRGDVEAAYRAYVEAEGFAPTDEDRTRVHNRVRELDALRR